MNNASPKVTIGLPVYNGENFIRDALDSIQQQTFKDFELIISDNASTDATGQICKEYAANDSRIRYLRRPHNVGAGQNFNHLVGKARGQYFKWWAHDDLCAPDFIERAVNILEEDPSVVLVYSRTQDIDETGQAIKSYPTQVDVSSKQPARRFLNLMQVIPKHHSCFEIFGLMQTSVLQSTPLFGNYAQADRVLIGRLLLHGRFHEIKDYLFFRRMHSGRSNRVIPSHVAHKSVVSKYIGPGPLPPAEWFSPEMKGRIVFPYWRHWAEYLDAIKKAPLTAPQKLKCFLYLGYWWTKNTPRLGKDIILATEHALAKYVLNPAVR